MPKRFAPRQKPFVIGGAVAGALLGAVAGHLGYGMLERLNVQDVASGYLARADTILDEAVAVLGAMAQSTLPPCSNDDIRNMRKLTLTSRFLKGVARQEGERLLCTSAEGALTNPVPFHAPDFVTAQGLRVLLNAEPVQLPESHALALMRNDASVLISHATFGALTYPGLKQGLFGITADHRAFQIVSYGVSVPADMSLSSGAPLSIDGVRHEVVCSQRHSLCVVATSQDGFDPRQLGFLSGMAVAGLLAGAAAGFGAGAARASYYSLGSRFGRALRSDNVSVVYQPIVRLADRRTVSLEVLARWRLPDGTAVPPDLFVSAAEQAGFATELTRYVVRKALDEIAPCLKRDEQLTVTINACAEDILDPDFVAFVHDVCARRGIRRAQVGFELTERITANIGEMKEGIDRLRLAGHYIYIDDFGVEHSNLSYLAGLQFDGVKLDRSFVTAIGADDRSDIIARKTIQMVSQLGLVMVIEGIETTAQADHFSSLSAELRGQGWLFGKPMDLQQTKDHLAAAERERWPV